MKESIVIPALDPGPEILNLIRDLMGMGFFDQRNVTPQSADPYSRNKIKRIMISYLLVGGLCLIFSIIYSRYSHGVTSAYMTFLCLFPLLLGAVPNMMLLLSGFLPRPFRAVVNLYGTGLAAMTLSSAMRGIFEIAGTGSDLQAVLMIAGIIFLITGVLVYILQSVLHNKRTGQSAA